MSTQVGENSSLLALLLEPAKGTLEGLSVLDPDAGHPLNRLLQDLVRVRTGPPVKGLGKLRLTLLKIPRVPHFVKWAQLLGKKCVAGGGQKGDGGGGRR